MLAQQSTTPYLYCSNGPQQYRVCVFIDVCMCVLVHVCYTVFVFVYTCALECVCVRMCLYFDVYHKNAYE